MKKAYNIYLHVAIPDNEADDPYGYIRGELAMLRASFDDMRVTYIGDRALEIKNYIECKTKRRRKNNGKKR
jgi:hypothetical protein